MANDSDLSKRKKPAIPDGYKTEQAFLNEMMERYDRGVEADDHNREAGLQDIEFTYGDQWDSAVRARRETARKPVLSKNNLPAYVGQVVNNRLLNETEIRVYPDKGGTKEVAEIRQGLIKSIFKNSDADFARDEANKYQVICGVGAFQLTVGWADNDVFDRDIKIAAIPDPFSMVLDDMSVEPTGADANWGFVTDDIPNEVYKARWPWASMSPFPDSLPNGSENWFGQDAMRVASYWRMVEKGEKTLVLTPAGTTLEIPETLPDGSKVNPDEAIAAMVAAGSIAMRDDGTPYSRTVPRRFAQMYLCSGASILEGPLDLPISSLPIFRVPGWELRRGTKVYRWGLVRFLKDPVRLNNYMRSVIAEQLVAAPRNKWLATKDAVSGYEKEWRNSHLSDDPMLMYNGEGVKPERIAPPPIDAGLLQQAAACEQDIRDVSNIHEATLGQKSNEVSGKALQERQAAADLGSYHYRDRMRMADERCAKIINELIPIIYDTQRIVTIMGDDNKATQVTLNDPSQPNNDVTLGKYGITVSTGPSTITKRALAAEQMMAFVNAVPETASLVMDLVAEAQDWPKAGEFAERFREAAGKVDPENVTPEQQQAMAQQQQKQQIAEQIELMRAQAEIDKLKADAEEARARAQNLLMMGEKAISDAQARSADVEGKNLERDFEARLRVVETALAAEQADNAREQTTEGDD